MRSRARGRRATKRPDSRPAVQGRTLLGPFAPPPLAHLDSFLEPPCSGDTTSPLQLQACLGREPSARYRLLQRPVIALVLVGVILGELDEGPVEGIALAQVGGD